MWKQVQIVLVLLFLFSTLMFCLVAQASLDDKSLVLYLSFDEGKGDIAKDSSKHGHDGTLINNPKWVGGKFGKALEFDGNKETHVKVPITDALQLREKFSAAFWVKRGKQIRDWNYMIGGGSLKWHVIFQNATKKTYLWTRSGGAWAQKAISDDIQPEDWVHITVTHDTGSKIMMYYNGKKSGEGPKPPKVDEIDGSFMVGARHPGVEFFTGVIDEVHLFNRVISTDDITKIIAGPTAVRPTGKLTTTWSNIKAKEE